ncbi:MAG TPA: YraN family protein [Solirubrobacteraceae bacterium]|nr:YraN family protein [Solirubrobacteraceae bacterium]
MRPRHPPLSRPAAGSTAARGDDRRRLGARGEQLAAEHLERLGFSELARNARTGEGEIDLIAFDGRTLVFAEVKTRRLRSRRAAGALADDPLASLRPRQRLRLRRAAVAWLAARRAEEGAAPFAQTLRFDAIGVVLDGDGALLRLDHLEAAW